MMMQVLPTDQMRSKASPVHRCHRHHHHHTHHPHHVHHRRQVQMHYGREEPFPDWLEEKIDLPIFEDLPPPLVNLDMINPGMKPINNMDIAMKPQMNCISPMDIGKHTTIPSPMDVKQTIIPSPMDIAMKPTAPGIEVVAMKPHNQTLVINPIQYIVPQQMEQPMLMQELLQDALTPPDSPRSEDLVFTMLQEMQPHELDELVRMRVESLVESPVDSQCESESVSSPAPSTSDSGYSDPEWTMPSTSDVRVPKRRRVTKPYSRTPPEEKKLRKKEQNKNAATRYRMKKKQEIEEILGEEKQLLQKNDQLKAELTELGREIKYLKNLMRDLFKAKGLIK
ncbi:cyclic AMP-dependent transcription factor ATF-5-like isoform X1 [Macrosteles quadrilineatus]|uniref:cyclic AMP-dependent transcription factor ATF-5-like isoform X1 n=1 Tax=Macrosteles quadrilineatus TaxID=74068 RepID=UPI0023E0E75A|nr:cyclic AMP-dependent transcription factor ATF-5-like isoform X1 [Macrosteles quadrilineatus]